MRIRIFFIKRNITKRKDNLKLGENTNKKGYQKYIKKKNYKSIRSTSNPIEKQAKDLQHFTEKETHIVMII